MPIHEIPSTVNFLRPFLDQYDPNAPPRHPIVTGSYLPKLDAAKAATQTAWKHNFGRKLPEHFAYTSDNWTDKERDQLQVIQKKLIKKLPQYDPTLAESIAKSKNWSELNLKAAQLRRSAYIRTLKFKKTCPRLQFTEPIEQVPHIISPYLRSLPQEKNDGETTCIAGVFGMNILHFIPGMNPEEFTPSKVGPLVHAHRNTHHLSPRRLPHLLGLLGTAYAAQRAGAVIRSATTIGCDFGEIEDKVITPMRKRRPNVRCVINLVLASDSNPRANHAAVVTDTSPEHITLHDPKYESPQTSTPRELYERWVSANMQAVVTFAVPL